MSDETMRLVPVDSGPNFSDSTLPVEMIYAGAEAIDRATDDMANYVSGETIDWDSGMMAVAVYRAMLAVAESLRPPSGGKADCPFCGQDWDQRPSVLSTPSTRDEVGPIAGEVVTHRQAALHAETALDPLTAMLRSVDERLNRDAPDIPGARSTLHGARLAAAYMKLSAPPPQDDALRIAVEALKGLRSRLTALANAWAEARTWGGPTISPQNTFDEAGCIREVSAIDRALAALKAEGE